MLHQYNHVRSRCDNDGCITGRVPEAWLGGLRILTTERPQINAFDFEHNLSDAESRAAFWLYLIFMNRIWFPLRLMQPATINHR